jgi:hypothetical protein
VPARKKDDDAPKVKKPRPPLWMRYQIRWRFLTRLCGSTLGDPEVVKRWLDARKPRVQPAGARSLEDINDEVLESLERGEGEAPTAFAMLVFQKHHSAIHVRASTIRAHLKDCARQLSPIYGRIQGERAFSTKVINGVYFPNDVYWIPVRRPNEDTITEPDGHLTYRLLTEADGAYDKAVHVRGLSALKRIEYLEAPTEIEFPLLVLAGQLSRSDLDYLFSYGGTHGYGGERGDGEGRYEFFIDDHVEAVDVAGSPAGHPHGGSDHSQARTDSGRAGAPDDNGESRGADGPAAQGHSQRRPTGTVVPQHADESRA